uniref:DNA polymerase n=1 Tax=uncultured marine virus TaxID=186617 RepID=A0A0F7L8M5_9VIRU|nr:DNA polymerase [uncultured marine virus]
MLTTSIRMTRVCMVRPLLKVTSIQLTNRRLVYLHVTMLRPSSMHSFTEPVTRRLDLLLVEVDERVNDLRPSSCERLRRSRNYNMLSSNLSKVSSG